MLRRSSISGSHPRCECAGGRFAGRFIAGAARFSPHNNADKARARAQVVLRAMLRNGYITQAQADGQVDVAAKTAVSMPLAANRARYFADWVMRGLDDVIGSVVADMVIETTLDLDLQGEQRMLARFIVTHGVDLAVSQGAIMVMRDDGAVLAMVGGANYSASQFNRAVQARRQPGSAFKPILYVSALEQGWLPEDMILDAPFSPDEYDYTPRNFNDEYAGEVTLMQALGLCQHCLYSVDGGGRAAARWRRHVIWA